MDLEECVLVSMLLNGDLVTLLIVLTNKLLFWIVINTGSILTIVLLSVYLYEEWLLMVVTDYRRDSRLTCSAVPTTFETGK